MARPPSDSTVVGLFAGIGGIEEGFRQAGFHARLLCEYDEPCARVLAERFPKVPLHGDVRTLESIPACEVLVAGFPCQDLSQAGRTEGIRGLRSSLVGEVLRLVANQPAICRYLVLENVPFMLSLNKGEAMEVLAQALEELGFAWAYRVVDTRAFGLPQRRRRVLVVASRFEDPRDVLFGEDAGEPLFPAEQGDAYGFYWTEGLRGLGWAVDSVPTLKGGSTIGIPSPPALWIPREDTVRVPALEDAERLQGFEAGWTDIGTFDRRESRGRWKMVGNAVSVPVARWLGGEIHRPKGHRCAEKPLQQGARWPTAAWGRAGERAWERHEVVVSPFPYEMEFPPILEFLHFPTLPLSHKAACGFLSRAQRSGLHFLPGFLSSLERYTALDRALAAS